jgi:hypothetical protein
MSATPKTRSPTSAVTLIPVWGGVEYPRHDEGVRLVCATKVQGPEWIIRFSRWSIRVEFALTDEPGVASYFMNMGSNRERPHVGRGSKYYAAWTMANGGPPVTGQQMDPAVFVGKFFHARIADCAKDSKKQDKPDEEVYSHVSELIELVSP